MSPETPEIISPSGIHHVRLTVTDIARSKAFYTTLLGSGPAIDKSDVVGEPGVRDDPQQFYGGCVFSLGNQLLGLRPVAEPGDSFVSTRVGLDHISLAVDSRRDLDLAAQRLEAAGVPHGEVTEIGGMAILSLQDPDDINLELAAALG